MKQVLLGGKLNASLTMQRDLSITLVSN